MEADSPSPDWLSLSPPWTGTVVHLAMQEAPYDEEGWVSSGDEARDGTLVPGKDKLIQALPPRPALSCKSRLLKPVLCAVAISHLPSPLSICSAVHASACGKLLLVAYKASCL